MNAGVYVIGIEKNGESGLYRIFISEAKMFEKHDNSYHEKHDNS